MTNVMPFLLKDAERPLRYRLDQIDTLFRLGYRDRQQEILENIEQFGESSDILSYFLQQVTKSRKLVNMIGAQCYLLHSGENYYARLNFWLPKMASTDVIQRRVEQYFSIGVLHNHSFDFFTVGLLGTGYYNQFYRYEADDLDQYEVGDQLLLSKTKSLKLGKGKALFVTKSFDFHTQFEPDDFSISLNFIPKIYDFVGSKDYAQLIVDPKTYIVQRKFLSDPKAPTLKEMALV